LAASVLAMRNSLPYEMARQAEDRSQSCSFKGSVFPPAAGRRPPPHGAQLLAGNWTYWLVRKERLADAQAAPLSPKQLRRKRFASVAREKLMGLAGQGAQDIASCNATADPGTRTKGHRAQFPAGKWSRFAPRIKARTACVGVGDASLSEPVLEKSHQFPASNKKACIAGLLGGRAGGSESFDELPKLRHLIRGQVLVDRQRSAAPVQSRIKQDAVFRLVFVRRCSLPDTLGESLA